MKGHFVWVGLRSKRCVVGRAGERWWAVPTLLVRLSINVNQKEQVGPARHQHF
jgi:hypothetical protein